MGLHDTVAAHAGSRSGACTHRVCDSTELSVDVFLSGEWQQNSSACCSAQFPKGWDIRAKAG